VATVEVKDAGTIAYNIKNGVYTGTRPAGAFEATARSGRVFARYIEVEP
jgi:hypothetical protein